jgi:hypothetical protein
LFGIFLGCKLITIIPLSFKSALRHLVAMFRAVLLVRYGYIPPSLFSEMDPESNENNNMNIEINAQETKTDSVVKSQKAQALIVACIQPFS